MTSDYWNRKHFSEYVARCLDEREIRPWYAAYYCETYDSIFRKYMKGAGLPSPIKLIMLGELLECSVNDLLGYEYYATNPRENLFDSGRDTRHVTAYFVDQVTQRMRALGLEVDAVAKQVEISTYTMKEYIEHRKLPDTAILLRICDALNCTPSELLGY